MSIKIPVPTLQLGNLEKSIVIGMTILAAGLIMSILHSLIPITINAWLSGAFSLHPMPTLSAAEQVTQVLWCIGALLLTIVPYKMRAWGLLTLEINLAIAAAIPLLGAEHLMAAIARAIFTQLGIIALALLGTIPKWAILTAWFPPFWLAAWREKRSVGGDALAVVGSEFLCWGYALFGSQTSLAWLLLLVAAVVLTKYGWAKMKAGNSVAVAWYYLNLLYAAVGASQLSLVLAAKVATTLGWH
jgi:hypothetical protein